MHFGLFHYCTKLGAKRAELVQLIQKFVPRNHIGIFSTNAPDPPHWTLNSCIGAFLSVWEHLAIFFTTWNWCKTGWTGATNAQVRAMKSHRNFSQQTHPIHPIGSWTHIMVRLGLCFYGGKINAKRDELVQLMQKFVARSRTRIFRNECTRSTPLDPILMFCCIRRVWVHLGPFSCFMILDSK